MHNTIGNSSQLLLLLFSEFLSSAGLSRTFLIFCHHCNSKLTSIRKSKTVFLSFKRRFLGLNAISLLPPLKWTQGTHAGNSEVWLHPSSKEGQTPWAWLGYLLLHMGLFQHFQSITSSLLAASALLCIWVHKSSYLVGIFWFHLLQSISPAICELLYGSGSCMSQPLWVNR